MDEQYKQHGAFSWCELLTTDVKAAKTFYTKLFGWDTEEMTMPGMTYTVVKAGGKGIGGIMAVPQKGMPPMWGAYVTVDDVDATAKTAETTRREAVDAAHGHPEGRTVLRHPGPPGGRHQRHHLQNVTARTRTPKALRKPTTAANTYLLPLFQDVEFLVKCNQRRYSKQGHRRSAIVIDSCMR